MLLCIDYYLFYPTKFISFPNQYRQTLVKIHSIRYQNSDKIILCHIKMLQCSCNDISDCEVRLRKSCLQLEKIVTLELESTDLEYCSLERTRLAAVFNIRPSASHASCDCDCHDCDCDFVAYMTLSLRMHVPGSTLNQPSDILKFCS